MSLVAALILTACGSGQAGARQEASKDKPFAVAAVATFDEPWAISFLPGRGVALTSMALVTQKAGKLLLVDTTTGKATEVAGAPKVAYGGQGGFGDGVPHPDFAGNSMIYLSWVESEGDQKGAVVGRAKLVLGDGAPRLEGLEVIWRQEPKVTGSGHFGHRIAFGPDGMLYVSSGERQKFDPAQDLNGNLGKVVRLTDTGMIPSDNPFYDQGRVKAQIWSYGHRNPLGLAFDPEGRLWNVEMGPRHGDELNLVKKGANYGYPKVSNGDHYSGIPIPDHRPGDGFEAPKVFWNPAISPGGMMIYSGALFPRWKGDAFIGALGGEALVRVDLNGEEAAKGDLWPMNARIRDVEQGPDGAIWLLEDGEGGRLLKLAPKP
jgi:glucose/arabinose dehydrogenase